MIKSMSFVDKDTLIVSEMSYYTSSLKIYYLFKEEKLNTSFIVKPFRSAHIRYPFYIFIHGSKEIWMINLKYPEYIHRFYIGSNILCVENYNPMNGELNDI